MGQHAVLRETIYAIIFYGIIAVSTGIVTSEVLRLPAPPPGGTCPRKADPRPK